MGSNPATPTDESQGVTVKCSLLFILRMDGLPWLQPAASPWISPKVGKLSLLQA